MRRRIRKVRKWWLEKRGHEYTEMPNDYVFHHWMCWCRGEL